jgi:hypothetical protein
LLQSKHFHSSMDISLCGFRSRSGTNVEQKNYLPLLGMGYALKQLWETALQPEGRGFDSRWCHWKFSLTWSIGPHYCPGADSASKRNEYTEYFLGSKGGRCVGLTTLPPPCADCLTIWEPQPPGNLRNFPRFALPFYCFEWKLCFLLN